MAHRPNLSALSFEEASFLESALGAAIARYDDQRYNAKQAARDHADPGTRYHDELMGELQVAETNLKKARAFQDEARTVRIMKRREEGRLAA